MLGLTNETRPSFSSDSSFFLSVEHHQYTSDSYHHAQLESSTHVILASTAFLVRSHEEECLLRSGPCSATYGGMETIA